MDKRLQPPLFKKWPDADESTLVELKEIKIDLHDMALVRHHEMMKRQLFVSVASMTIEERVKLHYKMETCNKVQTEVERCNEAPPPCDQEPPLSVEHEAESQGVWI